MASVPERFDSPTSASLVAVGCGVFALLLLIGGLAMFGLGIGAVFDVLFASQPIR